MYETKPLTAFAEDIDGDKFTGTYNIQMPGVPLLVNYESKRIILINEKFTDTFGYSYADVNKPGFSLGSVIDEIQLERLDVQVSEMREGKADRFIAYEVKKANGQYVITYIYVYPFEKDYGGDVVQLYLLPEFSMQKTPYLSFDTRELFLEQLSKFDFGTFEWIISSNKVFWSEGVYEIYEVDREKQNLDSSFVLMFTHPDDKERIAEIVNNVLENQSRFETELRIVTAKGSLKTVQVSGKVVPDAMGNPLKFIGSVRDITAERAIERKLEGKIAELNKSNAELEEFAYVASHDLQEPLRKITTFCNRLSEKYFADAGGDGKMYMDRIIASADNMRMLIHNLLEFSRISKTNEPFVPVNLNVVLRETINDLELLIEETGTQVVSEQLPDISSSFMLVKQLFTNLVNNAIKFRKTGEPAQISVSSAVLSTEQKQKFLLKPETKYFDIVVRDNGIGFDNEYAGRIFHIFQRLHGKADYPGSGIGLAICKKIVEKHNGLIYAEGAEGSGAVFHVILPEG